mmetsp:Transcript_46485/g.61586  ORF Transcript_46485/g.61586 Transcript_46485/m.61586 type:complete len:382 (-) Transcript_46485:407-1552(-)
MKKMKQTLFLLTTALLVAFGFNSCNEDIEVSASFTETAVVYGLLDQSESVHMIKITRAFIGPGNSLEISQIPDSNYFQNVSATITERLSTGSIGRTWTLYDTLVETKDTDGVFYAPEQRVYAFRTGSSDNSDTPTQQLLLDNATYDLNIVINAGESDEFEVSGSTDIVSGISTTTDSPNYQFKFATNSVSTGEYVSSLINVTHGNSAVVNTSFVVDYKEYIGADSVIQSFNWTIGETEVNTGFTTNFSASGESFYNLINSNCATGDPGVTRRNLEGITVKVVGGSSDLYNYILVNQPSSSIAQTKPTFTNLTATNDHPVLGIFSSRYTYTVYHPMSSTNQNTRCIDRNSTMELCIGPITGSRLFCSQQQLDIVQGQPWACN